MKKIREGIFETNSSSSHAIGIAKNGLYSLESPLSLGKIEFLYGLKFDCDTNYFTSVNEKFTYLLLLIQELKHDDFQNVIKYLSKTLHEFGIKEIYYPENIIVKPSNRYGYIVEWKFDDKDVSYVRGGDTLVFALYNPQFEIKDKDSNFLNIILNPNNRTLLYNFLFDSRSFISTTSDEGDGIYLPMCDNKFEDLLTNKERKFIDNSYRLFYI